MSNQEISKYDALNQPAENKQQQAYQQPQPTQQAYQQPAPACVDGVELPF